MNKESRERLAQDVGQLAGHDLLGRDLAPVQAGQSLELARLQSGDMSSDARQRLAVLSGRRLLGGLLLAFLVLELLLEQGQRHQEGLLGVCHHGPVGVHALHRGADVLPVGVEILLQLGDLLVGLGE